LRAGVVPDLDDFAAIKLNPVALHRRRDL